MGHRKTIQLASFMICQALWLVSSSNAAKILLVTADHQGHVTSMLSVGKQLQEIGHQVRALVIPKYQKTAEDYDLKTLVATGVKSVYHNPEFKTKFSHNLIERNIDLKFIGEMVEIWTECSIQILENTELMKQIKDMKFDLAIIEGNALNLASYIIPYKFGIPYVTMSFSIAIIPWWIKHPLLPSMDPDIDLSDGYITNFVKRSKKLFITCMQYSTDLVEHFYSSERLLKQYAPNRPFKTMMRLHQDSELTLLIADPMFVDFPTIESTHVKLVGFFGGQSARPLKGDLKKYLDSSKSGVILASLASLADNLPHKIIVELFKTFERFPHDFIFRYNGTLNGTSVPKNVKILEWINQNDILGHPNVKLLITHGGLFGQYEALSNNVPVLTTPFFADQLYNAFRAEKRGFGKVFDLSTASSDDMESLIQEMLSNRTYKENIIRINKLRASLPKGEVTASFWIDYVIRHGGGHFKPTYMDMPLYQFFMLDIIGLIILVLLVLALGSLFVFYKCLSYLQSKYKQKQE